nr:reverse transcriptase domain-containing protein [Tanacetum cinerariifolium]
KSSDANSSSSSEIAKLTHVVNQQTSVVTTSMTAILKQFQATPPPASVKAIEEICVTFGGAHPYYQCLVIDGNTFPEFQYNIQGYVSATAVNYNQGPLPSNTIANPKGELKAITTRSGIVLDGPFVPMPPPFVNPEEDEPVILKKLLEKLEDAGKFLISCGFSELKCKALADLGASINLMRLSVWKKLGLPELISTRITLELANRAICTPAGIARDVFVPTVRALIDVHEEEMILCDGDERLTLNMRHDTSSYSNQHQKESINIINIFNDSCEDYLEDLFAINHLSGNPTLSSYTDLTSPEVKDDIFDPKGDIVLIEELLNLDSTKDLPLPRNINPLSGSSTSSSSHNHLLMKFTDELALIIFLPRNDELPFDIESDLREIEYLLNHDPTKEMDSILKDSVDEDNLANNLVDTIPEMFTDEHTLDYSSPLIYDDFDDDFLNLCPIMNISSDFLPSPEYDSTKKFSGLKLYSRFHSKMRKKFSNPRFSLLKEFILLFSRNYLIGAPKLSKSLKFLKARWRYFLALIERTSVS